MSIRYTSVAALPTMLPFLLLVATTALGCDQQYARHQTVSFASYSIDPESWFSPSTEDMECIRGYSDCWAPGTYQDGCTNEYSFTDPDTCTSYSVSFVGPKYTSSPSATGVVIDNNSTVREDDKNFDEALWNNVLTPTSGCSLHYRVIACNHITANCSSKDIELDPSLDPKTREKTDDCQGYFVNALAFDSSEPSSDLDTFNIPTKENEASGKKQVMSSITAAWTTTLTNKSCIAAYNVCWKKKNTAYVGCQRALRTHTSTESSGPVPNFQYKVSVDVLSSEAIKSDEVTSTPISDSSAARHLCNSLIAIPAVLCLLGHFTSSQK